MKSLPIQEIVNAGICSGCGACAYAEPDRFEMSDKSEHGRRPTIKSGAVPETGLASEICPGRNLDLSAQLRLKKYEEAKIDPMWGPIITVYEGHASDNVVQRIGSSGGLITALAMFGLEKDGAEEILHTGADYAEPWKNRTIISTTSESVIGSAGSRYSPSSPCEGLSQLMGSPGSSVFIGKPCDVAALESIRKLQPTLESQIKLSIAFFCAGVPSTSGAVALLDHEKGGRLEDLRSVKYRGDGWPGKWRAVWQAKMSDALEQRELSYEESWGFLQRYRQWRCHICPDHSGEFADISVGDPWYRVIGEDEDGSSLIIARSAVGMEYLKRAERAGYITITRRDVPELIPLSQPNLIRARGALWGRLLAMMLLGLHTPRFKGFETFQYWLSNLSLREKAGSVIGTIKRIKARGLKKRGAAPH